MKKPLAFLFISLISLTAIFGTGCREENPPVALKLYAPDGAPALSIARLISDKTIVENLNVNIVTSNLISSYVTGENADADLAIVPVNLASKLLGSGEKYVLLGAVTHGNLFIMKKQSGVDITIDNLNELIGKKVGVINLANVPGLTFKAILKDNQVPFINMGEAEYDQNKVNLIGLSGGTEVVPNSQCDYFVVPEPAATTKQNATEGKLSIAGSLQQLYGNQNGYPQAVLVAKKSVIENNLETVKKVVDSFDENKNWLTSETTTSSVIVDAVVSAFVDSETTPTFNANNLNTTVINNCAINFISTKDIKTAVVDYISKLNIISDNAWGQVAEDFFYNL